MRKSILLFAALGLSVASCSTDNGKKSEETAEDYLPIGSGHYWTYKVKIVEDNTTGRDSVYVGNDTVISGNTFKKMKARSPQQGFYASSIHQSALRKSGSKILVTGSNSMSFTGEVPVDFAIEDFVLFDAKASENSVLDSQTGVLEQTLDGLPITIDYTAKSLGGKHLASYTASDGTVYSHVTTAQYIVNLKVSTVVQGFPIVILPTQDVLKSTTYYAEGIGVVATETTAHYELVDFSLLNIELPIPQTATQTTLEVLDTYHVEP